MSKRTREDRTHGSWIEACKKANDLSLPLAFALKRAGFSSKKAEKYVGGLILPKEETVDKFHHYLDNVEERRKKFYAV